MISKRQKIVLWSCFLLMILLSAAGLWFGFFMYLLLPMAINDSSTDFSQLSDDARFLVERKAQGIMSHVVFIMLALTILWASLAGFIIWWISKKSEPSHAENPNPVPPAT